MVRVQAPAGGAGSSTTAGRRDAGARLAIDDVLHLLDAHPSVLLDLVFDGDEHQGAARAMLLRDVADRAGAARRLADDQRMAEMQPRAREHPARQFDRRQETAALRVSVLADPRGRRPRQEIEPVPQGRQRVARSEPALAVIEGGEHGLHRRRRQHLVEALLLSDPLAEGVGRLVQRILLTIRSARRRLSCRAAFRSGHRSRPSTSASTWSVCSPSTGGADGRLRAASPPKSSGEPGTR